MGALPGSFVNKLTFARGCSLFILFLRPTEEAGLDVTSRGETETESPSRLLIRERGWDGGKLLMVAGRR